MPATKKKGKGKNGKATKLGAPEHFTGFKQNFLMARADSYQQALDSKTTTACYNKVTLDFVAKYGQEEPFYKEFAEDPPDPKDDFEADNHEGVHLSKEEAAEHAMLFSKLRTVSSD
jgi:hypothetical protein